MNELKFTLKDLIYIITLLIAMGASYVTYSNKIALLQDQVVRNKSELETHDLGLIEYKLNEMDHKLDKITNLLEE